MPDREATCLCGQLRVEVTGEPFAVSICNCLACKRRTGSAFGMEAGFRTDQVRIEGRYRDYLSTSDEADRKEHIDHFCPECGSPTRSPSPTTIRRSRSQGTHPPLLSRLRLTGLRHRADGAGFRRRLGRLIRRSVLPTADRVRLRLTTASVDRSARVDAPARAGVVVGPRTSAV